MYDSRIEIIKLYIFNYYFVPSHCGIRTRLCKPEEGMEALVASYGETCSDSDSESAPPSPAPTNSKDSSPLPPPPLSLLNPPNSLGNLQLQKLLHYMVFSLAFTGAFKWFMIVLLFLLLTLRTFANLVFDVLTMKGLAITLMAAKPAELGHFLMSKGTMLYMFTSQVSKS